MLKMTNSIFAFVKELDVFSYQLSVLDRVWNILFPDHKGKWQHLHVNKYKHTYYITSVGGNSDSLEYDDLGRFKRRIGPFISWEPLPILRPKEINRA